MALRWVWVILGARKPLAVDTRSNTDDGSPVVTELSSVTTTVWPNPVALKTIRMIVTKNNLVISSGLIDKHVVTGYAH